MVRSMRIAYLLLPALVACAAPADDSKSQTPGCSDGKCDGAEVWLYKAGQTPWVTCATTGNRVTCTLAANPQGVRPTQVMMSKGDVPFFYTTSLTAAAPSYQLPDTFSSSDQITLAARAPSTGLGDLRKVVRAPASGATVAFALPYDIWRITVTNVDAAAGSLILNHSVEITDGTFMLTQDRKVSYFGSLGVSPGADGASQSATYFVPVTAGGKVGAYYTASGIGGPPHLTLEKPGCYLMQGENPALVTYDENCARTRELVAPSTPTPDAPTEPMPDAPTEPTEPTPTCVAGTQFECDDAGETWNGSQCCIAGEVQCVEGSRYECDDPGESWTGSQCCIADTAQCVTGTQYECDDANESWTGSTCCLAAPRQCVQGTQYECDDAGEGWTGSQCCIAETAQCVTGTQYECDDANESWTGSTCCLAEPRQCVAGTQYECDDAGEGWTGSQCCVAPTLTCTPSTANNCAGGVFTGSQCCR